MTELNGKVKDLSKLIESLNLVTDISKNQFDSFSKKILNSLYNGESSLKIKRIIESELCLTYGLYNSEFNSDLLANQVMLWWDK